MKSISYAITVADEHEELIRLVNKILPFLREQDEIIIQADTEKTSPEVQSAMIKLTKSSLNIDSNLHLTYFPLARNFAAFKNNLKNLCKNDYIFFLDADEIPDSYLLEVLPALLETNKDVDLFLVPRINTVIGITKEHIDKWKWTMDEQGRINYPDFQTRIVANKETMEWKGAIHERLIGYRTLTQLPIHVDQLAIYHSKTIERQEAQNKFYNNIVNGLK